MKLRPGIAHALFIVVDLFILLTVPDLPCKAEEQERKIVIQPSELPAAITKAIREAFPSGQIVKIQKEVEGEDPDQYVMDMRSSGKEYEVKISPEGKIIEIKEVGAESETSSGEQDKKWTESFGQENCTFSSTGRNQFFILEPGYPLVLESTREKVVITVLGETKKIGNIRTRVIEE